MEFESPAVRVARGVALLDEKIPNWWEKINLEQFEIRSRCDCVIGQLTGSFAYRDQIDPKLSGIAATFYGFDSYNGWEYPSNCYERQKDDYTELQAEWLRVINLRRTEAPVVTWTHREPLTAGRG